MKLQGSIVALVTPMRADNSIDYPAVDRLVAWHLDQGTHGLLLGGSTGESPTLRPAEKLALYQHVLNEVKGRCSVIVGTGSNCTQSSIELTQAAFELGAQYSLLTTPYYNKPTQRGLFEHFHAIARAVPGMKHILYNVPSRSACVLDVLTVAELNQFPNIIGLKDSSTHLERLKQLKQQCRDNFSLLAGDDDITCEWVLAGGDGVISVTANIAPALMQQMVHTALRGQRELAYSLNQKLLGLHAELFCQSNPIPVKWLMAELNHIQPHLRLPLTWLEPAFEERLREAYQASLT